MLATVFDAADDIDHVRWLNRMHAPDFGIVVVHVPPDCSLTLLAAEILAALGRPVAPGTKHSRDHGHQWAHAWLATAKPRCDLVVYGSQRLVEQARDWLGDVGETPNTNVWLITPIKPVASTAQPHWRWATFQTHPWHERERHDQLAGFAIPQDWRADDLPPFPLSHPRTHALSTEAWAGLQRLNATYAGVRQYELSRLLNSQRPPAVRDVAAALARLTVISRDRPDLTVLSRHLEHDVFLRGAILTIDVDVVLQILGKHDADENANRSTREPAPSNPEQAARDIVNCLRELGRSASSHPCDIATDGTYVLEIDGVRRDTPPWYRWPLRAAYWLLDLPQQPHQQQRHTGASRTSPVSLFGRLEPLPVEISSNLRTGLEPLTSALLDAFTYQSYLDVGSDGEQERDDGFTV